MRIFGLCFLAVRRIAAKAGASRCDGKTENYSMAVSIACTVGVLCNPLRKGEARSREPVFVRCLTPAPELGELSFYH